MYEPPFPYFPRIETKAFLLKQPSIMDAQFWTDDQAVFLDQEIKEKSFRQLIHQLMRSYHEGHGVYWMAIDNATRNVQGVLALEGNFKQGSCTLNVLAYQEPFVASAWEEAFREILLFCFKTLRVLKISTEAAVYVGDWQDLLQNLGFAKDGHLLSCSLSPSAKG